MNGGSHKKTVASAVSLGLILGIRAVHISGTERPHLGQWIHERESKWKLKRDSSDH